MWKGNNWGSSLPDHLWSCLPYSTPHASGADPEILKVGCTKFSGPELPYLGFDPFSNLLQLPSFESLSSIQEYNLALDYMEILTEWSSIYWYG